MGDKNVISPVKTCYNKCLNIGPKSSNNLGNKSSTDGEIGPYASHWMPPCATLHIFPYPGSQDNIIRVSFGMQVTKTPIYPIMCPFPLFVAVHDH